MDFFAARDRRAAPRDLRYALAMVAVVLSAYTLLTPPAGVNPGLVWGVIGVLVAGAVALARAGDRTPGWVVAAMLVAGVVTLAGLNVLTRDASAAAQVFFLLPVVFAAAHLRPVAAWLVTAIAVLGEAVVTALLLPPAEAFTDTAYLSAVAVITLLLLLRANNRTDALLAELRHLAAVDPLTGLVTRRVLDDAASCALAADATAGTSFLVVDVDRFKGINDRFGHPVGDAVLVHVGRVLREMSGPDAVVSRLGGDELAVLLPGTPVEVARRGAEALAGRLRTEPFRLGDGHHVSVTVSIGVAHAPGHAFDLPGLYRAADEALYSAKRGGRDQVSVACCLPGVPASPHPRA